MRNTFDYKYRTPSFIGDDEDYDSEDIISRKPLPTFRSPYQNRLIPSKRTTPFSSAEPMSTPTFRNANAQYEDPQAEKGVTDYRSEIDKLYGTGEAMEKFYSHVQNVPKQEDYGPGIMGRIVAGLAGAGAGWQQGAGAGIKAAQSVIRRPYEQAIQEYEMKGQGLKAAADIEQARDAKRVAYLKELREFDEQEWKRINDEAKIQNDKVTAAARQSQAETAAKLARLTEERDATTDKREQRKLDNEIEKTKNDLTTKNAADATRKAGIAAVDRRTAAYREVGLDRNKRIPQGTKPREIVISPRAQTDADVSAAGELLNKPEYRWLGEQGIVQIGKDFVQVGTQKKQTNVPWYDVGEPNKYPVTSEDQEVINKFMKELKEEAAKKLRKTITLNASDSDEDSIYADLDKPDDEP